MRYNAGMKLYTPIIFVALLSGCDLHPMIVGIPGDIADAISGEPATSSAKVPTDTITHRETKSDDLYGPTGERGNPNDYGNASRFEKHESAPAKKSEPQAKEKILNDTPIDEQIEMVVEEPKSEPIPKDTLMVPEKTQPSEPKLVPAPDEDSKSTITEKNADTETDDILIVPKKNQTPIKPIIAKPKQDTIIVEAGNTLYNLSKKHDVPLRDLISVNHLDAPYTLKPGMSLQIPSKNFHIVTVGDTLYSISRMYGMDVNSLANTNNIKPPYALSIGQKLQLSASISIMDQTVKSAPKIEIVEKKTDQKPETKPAKTPDIKSGKPDDTPKTPVVITGKPSKPETMYGRVEPKKAEPKPTVKTTTAPKPEVKTSTKASPAVIRAIPAAGSRASSSFAWPVRGKIISPFGAKSNGLYNDGINISAKAGTTVKASENGVVAYAGNELKGLGNLVIIQHAGGWMTVYAHMHSLEVSRGDKVKLGEKVGTIGQTGRVTSPQLHFEIRKGTKAFDPTKQLR